MQSNATYLFIRQPRNRCQISTMQIQCFFDLIPRVPNEGYLLLAQYIDCNVFVQQMMVLFETIFICIIEIANHATLEGEKGNTFGVIPICLLLMETMY